MAAKVVITTFGSYGDLHPYAAIGLELQRRGHDVVLATSAIYKKKVESEGLKFHPVRPDYPDFDKRPEAMDQLMDGLEGPQDFFFSALHDTLEDTRAAARGATLLIAQPLTFATRIAAELEKVPWASANIAPIAFFSCTDPPILLGAEGLAFMRRLPLPLYRAYFRLVKWAIHSQGDRIRKLRADVGLGPGPDPLFDALHSPLLALGLFSPVFGPPQPDWPASARATGFCFHDRDGTDELSPELAKFLDAGEPPLVFTLGTAAVWKAGSFYAEAAEAARILGRRAVLLTGKTARNQLATLPEGVATFDYAPFSKLFPRAAAIVHQGGVGTTGQGLRSGRPTLVVPQAFEQPDNGDRVARLGCGRVLSKKKFTAKNAARALAAMLEDEAMLARCAQVGETIRAENGIVAAADAIEELLAKLGKG